MTIEIYGSSSRLDFEVDLNRTHVDPEQVRGVMDVLEEHQAKDIMLVYAVGHVGVVGTIEADKEKVNALKNNTDL